MHSNSTEEARNVGDLLEELIDRHDSIDSNVLEIKTLIWGLQQASDQMKNLLPVDCAEYAHFTGSILKMIDANLAAFDDFEVTVRNVGRMMDSDEADAQSQLERFLSKPVDSAGRLIHEQAA
ncbi:hypothetical protein [Pseudovibrio sp. POLY-S9]|uniref:hypothetical protein n=1 Tax=Pseudovibrio sp. POLY-S9 TaxID=1576596 RepID=UPI000ABC408F|nr:hypothetical protein [Pseudovibrio sp. POLY-S9]